MFEALAKDGVKPEPNVLPFRYVFWVVLLLFGCARLRFGGRAAPPWLRVCAARCRS